MKNYIAILIFLLPHLIWAQPFKVKEVRARYVVVNQSSYYDVHTVLQVHKTSEQLSIDSLQLDGKSLSPVHVSVLARSVETMQFVKGDSVLIKGTVLVSDTLIKNGLSIFYHMNTGRTRRFFINKSEIKRLEEVYFQHYY